LFSRQDSKKSLRHVMVRGHMICIIWESIGLMRGGMGYCLTVPSVSVAAPKGQFSFRSDPLMPPLVAPASNTLELPNHEVTVKLVTLRFPVPSLASKG